MVNEFDEYDEEVTRLISIRAFDRAAQTLTERWPQFLPARAEELRSLIAALPDELWASNASLLLALARSHRSASSANPFAALPYLDEAEAILARDDSGNELMVLTPLARASAYRGLGQLQDALAQTFIAEHALASIEVALPLRIELQSAVLLERGICMTHSGNLEEAGLTTRHGLALRADELADALSTEAQGCLDLVEFFAGSPTALHPDSTAPASASSVGDISVTIAAALVAIEHGDLECAERLLAEIETLSSGTEYQLLYLHASAIIRGSRIGMLEALETLQQIQLALHDWQSPSLAQSLHDAERISALIDLGEFSAARDSIEALEFDPQHIHCPTLVAARLSLLVGDFDAVLASTEQCGTLGDSHAPRTLAYIDVLRAAAHHALGDASTAAMVLDRALLHAAKIGWFRPFTVLPHDQLRRMLDTARERPQPEEALAALEAIYAECSDAIDSIAPLTSRERMILHHIAAGETRQEISSRLQVSPNTVKSQVRSIYRKLGAASRHEAIARASKYGITA
jgi:ATP/maltotriose-dependent transcriptional regulator MalT